jgi:hypothetical protein
MKPLIVSDPFHSRYGKHLSADEVNDLIKPKDEALDLVNEWLQDNDIEVEKLSTVQPGIGSRSPSLQMTSSAS